MFLTSLHFLLQSVFFGFCLWTLLWAFWKSKEWKIYYSLDDIDQVAVKTAIIVGIIYLINFCVNLPGSDRLFGTYWFSSWAYPSCFLLTQLFWFESIRTSKLIRALIALWTLFILLFEKVVIIITSLHRDYVVTDENLWLNFFLSLLLKVFVFTILLTAVMTAKQLMTKRHE